MTITDAMIVAGGHGTRLRPLALSTPEPQLPLCGRPLLEGMVRRLAEVGVTRVFLIVGADPAPFERVRADAATVGVEVEVVHVLPAEMLVAEVQTPSDTTFRADDWSSEYAREPRPLHEQAALQAITMAWQDNVAPPPVVEIDPGEMRAVSVLEGHLRCRTGLRLSAGDCFVIPAAWQGDLRAGASPTLPLEVTVPSGARGADAELEADRASTGDGRCRVHRGDNGGNPHRAGPRCHCAGQSFLGTTGGRT